jgi:CubicO group peptidase (beta-lactamase class C family)
MTGTYVPELQAVDTLLQNFMVGKPIPGGTIAITHNDKVIYERGIGYRDARSAPMQENALMRLASVSKPITASAIHQLAKDVQLDLNAKVFNIAENGGILDITPYNGTLGDSRLGDITVQHLLGHQGGWNRDTAGDLAFRDVQIANAMGVPSPPGIANSAQYILSRPLQFAPGTAYNYSNIGYMFLGMVVEAASGQSYESYIDDKVLAPAGIPAWEVDAGRTFAADQNPREPVYSDPSTGQNVYNPSGPSVSWPYGGWDNEKALAYGGLIGSSKAIAQLANSRIAAGPEIGKLRSDYTTHPDYWWYHTGSLPGTDTLMLQASWKDWTYSILFDRRPADASSYSGSLVDSMQSILEGMITWPAPLVYAGDFTNDQWLTPDDITLFKQALALGSETSFTEAFPTARYLAGDFDSNGLVNVSDAAGLIGALQHAGVPAEYVALVPELPGDYNRDGTVDSADYVVWRSNVGDSINLPNETISLGVVDQADYDVWRAYFGASLGPGSDAVQPSTVSLSAAIPEPTTLLLLTMALAATSARPCRDFSNVRQTTFGGRIARG